MEKQKPVSSRQIYFFLFAMWFAIFIFSFISISEFTYNLLTLLLTITFLNQVFSDFKKQIKNLNAPLKPKDPNAINPFKLILLKSADYLEKNPSKSKRKEWQGMWIILVIAGMSINQLLEFILDDEEEKRKDPLGLFRNDNDKIN